MPLQIICPLCKTTYRVADGSQGRRVRCKRCETSFVVANSAPQSAEDCLRARPADEPLELEVIAEATSRPHKVRSVPPPVRHSELLTVQAVSIEKKRSGAIPVLLIVGGVAALVLACLVVVGASALR